MEEKGVLIVDDELQSRALIRKLITIYFPHCSIQEASDLETAEVLIHSFNPDLVFLDIQFKGETGFDLLDRLSDISFSLIFTTAHSEFAIKAFKYSALDYLLKPIDIDEFQTAVSKALSKPNPTPIQADQIHFIRQFKSGPDLPDKLSIPTVDGFLFVTISDIIYCHSLGNYTEIYLSKNQKILSSRTLGSFQELLQQHSFYRVHRSFLVNLAHVTMYKKKDGGLLVMDSGDEIEISRANRDHFLKIMTG
ncbi:MAG: response regulator transcription factor [Saprospiraceae bacterium]|nr:response regulator transcription factor [Saprospiraceae bacterium]